jgi:hypothetical protein
MALFETPVIQPMAITKGAVPLSQAPSLFPSGWKPAWGPVERATPVVQAGPTRYLPGQAGRTGRPETPVAASARGTGPKFLVMGQHPVPAARTQGVVQPMNAPQLQQGRQNPPWWRPSFGVWVMAPRFAQKTRRFSDHPLPVPSLQAYNSMQVASRPARIGGRTATRWPNPNIAWPTFGVGGT